MTDHTTNCVTCGSVIKIDPKKKIPLQCELCKYNEAVLPRGYKGLGDNFETGIHIEDVEAAKEVKDGSDTD